jgi:mRNA interferase YafQ
MRTISYANRFKKDFKRESRGPHGKTLVELFKAATDSLCADEQLPARYADHALSGEWLGDRDCHIKPDLVLIYRKPDERTLQLVRLGSHSELSM